MGLLRLFKKPNIEKLERTKDVEGLIVALGDESALVRLGAAEALGMIGDTRAVEPLITALSDESEIVRRSAIIALGRTGDVQAIPALEKAANDSVAAKEALGEIKSSDAYKWYLKEVIFEAEEIFSKIKAKGVVCSDELLIRSKQAFESGDYDGAKKLAEEAKKVASEKKAEYDSAVKSIFESEEILSEVWAKGVAVSDELLTKSKQAFESGDYDGAKKLAEELKGFVSNTETKYREARERIKSAESAIERAEESGCDTSSAFGLLKEANSTFDAGNYEEAIKYAKQSEDTTKKIQEESRPEITVNFPEETFPPNQWKKIDVTIQNTGSMHAREIAIEPSGEIEFRRIPAIPQLNTNKTETITIAMKPIVAGDVPIDIVLTCKDALDRDYTSSEEVWVTVADSTPERSPSAKQPAAIEIKRGYEVLQNSDLRFGIRVINNTDYAIMDVKTILSYPKTLFSLKGSEIQTLSNIDPRGKRTATYKLTPRACIHNEKIDATIFFKDHTGSSQNVPMRPKEVHCVCPFLRGKAMREGEFAELANRYEYIQEGLSFSGISVNEIAAFVKEACAHRLYINNEHEVDTAKIVYFSGESIGEKADYLLTAVIQPYKNFTQVALRAYSDKPYGLRGFLTEISNSLRHLVSSVQSAKEIGVIESKQVINILGDYVVGGKQVAGGDIVTGTKTGDVVAIRSTIGGGEKVFKNCPNCGKEVQAGEKFCKECGARLG